MSFKSYSEIKKVLGLTVLIVFASAGLSASSFTSASGSTSVEVATSTDVEPDAEVNDEALSPALAKTISTVKPNTFLISE